MSEPDPIPQASELRWPILVVLDAMGEENAILEFQDRVARHLALPAGTGEVLDPDTDEPLLTERLIRAIDDLYAAGAVDADEDGGRVWITDQGRRLTEEEVSELPASDQPAPPPAAGHPPKPTLRDWILGFFESWLDAS
jgi:Mrr N-terminal domain